jgi:exopolysaccharide biosynthesis protein
MASRPRYLTIATGVAAFLLATPAFSADGVVYERLSTRSPRPIVIHVVKIDLVVAGAELKAIAAPDPDGAGPAETTLSSPLELAASINAIVAINANAFSRTDGSVGAPYFMGERVRILGWVVRDGIVRSMPARGAASAWTDSNGITRIGYADEAFANDALSAPLGFRAPVRMAVSGFDLLLRRGRPVASADGAIHPRSGIGVSRDGVTVWFAVADGRQAGYSEGLTLQEWASYFMAWGAWDALNLDGGGSSVLTYADPSLRVVNSPSDFPLFPFLPRPVPVMLAVVKK